MSIFKTDGAVAQDVSVHDVRPWDNLSGNPFARTNTIGGFIDALAQRGRSSASSNNSNNDSVDLPADWLESLLTTEVEQLDKNMKYNAEQARITREYNAEEAKKLRDWQERLSNTSYQRAIADMMKAGLNPILAFQQGGATVPSGSSASANNASMSTSGGTSIGELAQMLNVLFKLLPSLGALFAML